LIRKDIRFTKKVNENVVSLPSILRGVDSFLNLEGLAVRSVRGIICPPWFE
jgi:hypothetical protein